MAADGRPPGAPFALGTFVNEGRAFTGLVRDERVADLTAHLGAGVSLRTLLDDWDATFARLQRLPLRAADFAHAQDELEPLPPVTPPGQIFQAGANYRQHVLDLMAAAAARGDSSDGLADAHRDRARAELEHRLAHGRPFVFLGSAHAMVGARDDVVIPEDCAQPDWELELTAVIGRHARRVTRDAALEHVAGYMIANDVTSRDALIRTDARDLGLDWLAGKNSPTFLPVGPLFVPAAFVPDPMDLRITLAVNGEVMQDESTADMVFDVAALVEFISQVSELRPGDLVLTGSPAGNGAGRGVFLKPGDVMVGEISGLGRQRNRCVAEAAPVSQRYEERADV
jgi:2-keto-4-pentenoate hydratase/2-oxohepta-3-ene-1,7-dioic acid hydratase in catechol pathway